jgi:sec-independent protein translocase protein TatA
MFDLGGGELLMILVGVLILFGPKKLPDLAQGLGKGLRQFRKAQQEFNDQITNAMRDDQQKDAAKRARPLAPNTISRGVTTPTIPEPFLPGEEPVTPPEDADRTILPPTAPIDVPTPQPIDAPTPAPDASTPASEASTPNGDDHTSATPIA